MGDSDGSTENSEASDSKDSEDSEETRCQAIILGVAVPAAVAGSMYGLVKLRILSESGGVGAVWLAYIVLLFLAAIIMVNLVDAYANCREKGKCTLKGYSF